MEEQILGLIALKADVLLPKIQTFGLISELNIVHGRLKDISLENNPTYKVADTLR